MINEERLFKILHSPHVSEKATIAMEKNNTFIIKVYKTSSKIDIINAIKKIFKVEVKKINTLVIKGKTKRHGKRIGRRCDWKKAYVSLKEGQNLDFVGGDSKS